MNKSFKKKLLGVFIGAFLLRIILIFTPAHVDIINHVDWGTKLWQYGFKDFYEQIFWGLSWPNQPIASIFLFGLIARLKDFLFNSIMFVNVNVAIFPSFMMPFLEKNLHIILLKLPFVFSDLGIGILIYKVVKDLVKKNTLALLAACFFLFNPALIYNSIVWGQTDSLISFLSLLGLWLFWKDKLFFGVFFFILSLFFKLSLIILLPLLIFMIWQKRRIWLRLLLIFMANIAIFLLFAYPFVHHGNVFTWLWYLYANRILPRQGDMLSGNAFNLWTLFYGIDFSLKENLMVLGMQAKAWGRIIFSLISIIFTLALFLKKKSFDFRNYLQLGIVYSFSAFLFLTNMHERYLYPSLVLLVFLIFLKKKYSRLMIIFIILSFVYLLNLYNLWWMPRFEALVNLLSINNALVPRILSFSNIVLFLILLKEFYYEKKLV